MQIKKILPVLLLLLVTLLFSNTAGAYSDGTIDTTFNPGAGATILSAVNAIRSVSIQPDGKMIIAGDFTEYNGVSRRHIARVNADGSLDTTFNPGTGFNGDGYNIVFSTSLQSDGKIIVGGNFTSYEDIGVGKVVRLNPNGSLDASFDIQLGIDNTVLTTAVQSDGKILVGGNFTTYNGVIRRGIVRINSNGSLDTSFVTGSGIEGTVDSDIGHVNSISIQSDGKIIIGGYFNMYNGVTRNGVARINTDGTLDTTFNPGAGVKAITGLSNGVYSTSIQSDGKIIIGGYFNMYNGVTRNGVARINTDGTLDTTFNSGTGIDYGVFSTSIQQDGKVIIAGVFTKYNGVNRISIARINTDGTLDTTFNPGTGIDKVIFDTSLQSDGKIMIVGGFTNYNGVARNSIARLASVAVNSVPTPTTAPDMTTATDNGISNTDNITSDTTPDFQVVCVTGNTVTLYVDNLAVTPTAVCAGNTITITLANPLTSGAHSVTYTEKNAGIESGKSPALPISITNNLYDITLLEIVPIGLTVDTTPNYTFATDKPGAITYGGSCSSVTASAVLGFNLITLNALPLGTYSNCTIKVIDAVGGHESNVLKISPFTITTVQAIISGAQQQTQIQQPNSNTGSTVGCTSNTKFSPITGNKCPNYNATVGCTSSTQYSPVTGNMCPSYNPSYIPPQTTFVDTNPVVCPHFTQYLKRGSEANDTNEMMRWQAFLNKFNNEVLVIDGTFGTRTFNAIRNFQERYKQEILAPWGIDEPTGRIYQSTRAQGNKIFGCSERVVLDNGVVVGN